MPSKQRRKKYANIISPVTLKEFGVSFYHLLPLLLVNVYCFPPFEQFISKQVIHIQDSMLKHL
jgi:hypothetical protein